MPNDWRKVHKSKSLTVGKGYRRLSAEYAAAEEHLNDGLGCISDLIRDAAAATHSLSCGTNDRDCKEAKYLQDALDLLESFHRGDAHRKESEVTSAERSSSSS